MRVLIAAVQYSDNFGDGLIFRALSNAILKNKEFSVDDLDIGGRKSFSTRVKNGGLKSKILRSNNTFLLYFLTVINALIVFFKSMRTWSGKIKNCDVCFIGGGNLISDVYLNFPIKIYFICLLCRLQKKDFYFVFVGVSKNFSYLGRFMFSRCFSSKYCIKVIVRDSNSHENFANSFGRHVVKLKIGIDPVVSLAKEKNEVSDTPDLPLKVISLNVVDPLSLISSSDTKNFPSEASYRHFVERVINDSMLSSSYEVVLYTNGASEDKEYLARLLDNDSLRKFRLFDVNSPDDLIHICSTSDFICCTRLHSAIVSFAVGTPFTVFNWDSKVEGFAQISGVSELILRDFSDSVLESFSITAELSRFELERELFNNHRSRCSDIFVRNVKELLEELKLRYT